MARIVVLGAGMGGLAVAARLGAQGHQVTVCEQARRRRRQARLVQPGRLHVRHRAEPAHAARGLPRPVPQDRRAAASGRSSWSRSTRSVTTGSPTAPSSTCPTPPAAGPSPPSTTRSAPAPAPQWAALMDRAGAIWEVTRGPFLESPLDGARTLLGRQPPGRRPAHRRAVEDAARARPRLPARPAAGDAARPVRHLHRLGPAPGAGRAGHHRLRRADLRRLVRARRPAPARRRAAPAGAGHRRCGADQQPGRRGARRGRAAPPGCGWPAGRRVEADVVVSDADAAHLYGDLVPAPSGRRRSAQPEPARRRRCPASCCCSPCAAAPRASRTTPCCSPTDYDAEFDAVFGSGPHAGRPVDGPDRLRQRPGRPGAAPGRRPRVAGSSWSTRRGTARTSRRRNRLGRSRVSPTRYADRVLELMAGARRSTSATGCSGARSARPPTWPAGRRAPGGAIYGTSAATARAPAFLRPANRSPVPGLFLVGGSSHPGGGLPLVGLSAAIVAELIGRGLSRDRGSAPGQRSARRTSHEQLRRDRAAPSTGRRPHRPCPSAARRRVDAGAEQEHRRHDDPGRALPDRDRPRPRSCPGARRARAGTRAGTPSTAAASASQARRRRPTGRDAGRAVRQPVGDGVQDGAPAGGPAGEDRDRAVEVVEQPGQRPPPTAASTGQRPPSGGEAGTEQATSSPAQVSTSAGTRGAASGRASR